MQQIVKRPADLVTVSHAARLLDVSEGTVRRLERAGQLAAVRLSNGTRAFERRTLERFAESRGAK